MLGNIISVDETQIKVKITLDLSKIQNIINMFVIIKDTTITLIGEIISIDGNIAIINMLGEFKNNFFNYGIAGKPSFGATVSLLSPEFVGNIISSLDNNGKNILIGKSCYYNDALISAKVDSLFGSHFAIMGSTGSGKSCGFARLIQNIFYMKEAPINAKLFIFDAYQEYKNAFVSLNSINPRYNFKSYSTQVDSNDNLINIPIWFLDVDDLALLLNVDDPAVLPVIEKALKFVKIFVSNDENEIKKVDSIIASALLDILRSGKQPSQIRDQFLSILGKYHTKSLSLETEIKEPGYTRTLQQCLLIDQDGKIQAINKINDYLNEVVIKDMKLSLPQGKIHYSIEDLLYAFEFALIDEGVLRSETTYNRLNGLLVRLSTIVNSDDKIYFNREDYVTLGSYIKSLYLMPGGQTAQIINFSINNLDDRFAKAMTKIYARLLFKYNKEIAKRGETPFNIILEEAHRYVQNDKDVQILGYNIFERIAKEGRKYSVLLGLITQRPSELSETVVSQCNNFFLFKMMHPSDLTFVRLMVPNITEEVIKRMKTIPSGICMTFGTAFKMPTLIKMDMPSPSPSSSSSDITNRWFVNN